jgi:hypothetical protein
MYPNSEISPGAMVAVALTVLVTLAIWLGAVYRASREPAHHEPEDHRN